MKTCAKCKRELEESCFNKRKETLDGLRYTCKECEHTAYKKWKESNPEKAKERWRMASNRYHGKDPATRNLKCRIRRVNMTESEYFKILESQKGRCKICGIEEKYTSKKRLHIDHNHSTGKIRGLLCSNCNTALGLMKDDVLILKSAIQYLCQDR